MEIIAEFLLARIAEDEALAREGGRWDGGMEIAWRDVGGISESLIIGTDRVLAECEAKRRIVESRAAISLPSKEIHDEVQHQREYVWRLLALPYADHPDYLEEWRP